MHGFRSIPCGQPTNDARVTRYCVTRRPHHSPMFKDDELWFGKSLKNKRELTLSDFRELLERVPDGRVYPEIPPGPGTKLTVAPDDMDGPVFIKRPGLSTYDVLGTSHTVESVLHETLMMERISKSQHPNIIQYRGCRTNRGFITGIVLAKYEYRLREYIYEPEFQHLDKDEFVDALESAVAYIHSLGLAHNDINPNNIMIGDGGRPVLIDFGSCAPFGQAVGSGPSPGWYEELSFVSEKRHDEFSLKKMRTWIYKPEDDPYRVHVLPLLSTSDQS